MELKDRKRSEPGPWIIEHGIPIPNGYEKRDTSSNWDKGYVATLRLLKVGDSVVFPITILSAQQICSQEARRVKGAVKFVKRTVDGGIRIWRVK